MSKKESRLWERAIWRVMSDGFPGISDIERFDFLDLWHSDLFYGTRKF